MTLARWRAAAARLAAALALLVVATGAGEWLGAHTDDGCRTETHCLLCRGTQGHAAAMPAPALEHAVELRVDEWTAAPHQAPAVGETRPAADRGPPARLS